ncbi:MAG: DUF177 domain-containing protein [Rubrivivax sp.]|nr:MAG: DUF177 domain-containing protein [Rubrivivax sp.]
MKKDLAPRVLDVRALAQAGATLSGDTALAELPRLAEDTIEAADAGVPHVHWQAHWETRTPRAGTEQNWLRLEASTQMPMICQRCLGPMVQDIEVASLFRFVSDEATAMAEDDDSDEDLLVLTPEFDLLDLLEDELLMEMPIVPRHDVCPASTALPTSAADPGFQEERPNPFAVLQGLRGNKTS